MSQNKKSFKSNRRLLIIVALVLLLFSGAAAYYLFNRKSVGSNDEIATEKINLSPPSEAEIEETEQHKQNLAQKDSEAETNPTNDNTQDITPFFGFLLQNDNKNVEANGYLSGVIEDGGACTLTLQKDGVKVSETRKAKADAQSTICGLITISREKLSSGEWKATLSYSSSEYQGSSEERKIQVD